MRAITPTPTMQLSITSRHFITSAQWCRSRNQNLPNFYSTYLPACLPGSCTNVLSNTFPYTLFPPHRPHRCHVFFPLTPPVLLYGRCNARKPSAKSDIEQPDSSSPTNDARYFTLTRQPKIYRCFRPLIIPRCKEGLHPSLTEDVPSHLQRRKA